MFDNLYVMRYFRCTNLCLLVRGIDFELNRAAERGFTAEQVRQMTVYNQRKLLGKD